MKCLIINPNSDFATEQLLRRTASAFCREEFQADVVSMRSAPPLVVTYTDQAASVPELIELFQQKGEEYDGFVLACHADPNLELVQELAAGKPVYGIAQASMKVAAMRGNGFAVLTPSAAIIPKKFALARKYHCEEQLKTVQVSQSDRLEDLLEAAQTALKVPGVDSTVLGCANYSGAGGRLEAQLGVPVIDGLLWALILLEGELRIRSLQRKKCTADS